MPRRYSAGAARETTDLHAPWWSDERDPATGRYLARAVVYMRLSYADQKWVEQRLLASMNVKAMLEMAQSSGDVAALASDPAARDEFAIKAMEGMGGEQILAVVNEQEYSLLARLAEITEEDGTPMPLRDLVTGHLLPGAMQVLGEMDAEDMNFIRAEILKLDQADRVVPLLPQDAEKAAAGHPDARDGRGAAGVAEATFPAPGEASAVG